MARFRFILSGTPVVNSLSDIFQQYLFLDNGETFGQKFNDFRSKYFYDANQHLPRHCYYPSWQIRDGSVEAINKLIYTKAMRVKKSECLDLPPYIRQTVYCELTAAQKKIYKEMEADAVTEVNGSTVSADLAIKKSLRLQQIITGYTVDDNDNICQIDHNRTAALQDIVDSIPEDESFIIWAVFKQNYKDIRAMLNYSHISFGEIHGDVSAKEQQEAIKNLQEGRVRAVIAHPSSGGVGCNLTRASYSIYYSRNFSLEDDLQSEARNYRGGSDIHEKVTRIDIVTPGTIDEVVLKALEQKLSVSEAVLKYLKEKQ